MLNSKLPYWTATMLLLAPALALINLVPSASAATLVPVTGGSVSAELQHCGEDGSFVFTVDGKIQRVAAEEFIRWGQPVEPRSGSIVYLADGSFLVADEFDPLQIADEQLTMESKSLSGRIELPLEFVQGIVLRPPEDASRRDQLSARIRQADNTTDVVILDNGDVVEGTITGLSAEQLLMQSTRGGNADFDANDLLKRAIAIVFNPALVSKVPKPQSVLRVHLRDGSQVIATRWAGDQRQLRVTLAFGTELAVPYLRKSSTAKALIRPIVIGIRPFVSQITYLSDVKPASYQHRPFLSVKWPYHLDRNALGDRLVCAGQRFDKGIGMHSAASLSYVLDKRFQRFDAALGIDDAAAGGGSVVFRVYIDDGSGKWQARYESGVIRGGDAPVEISVDVSEAKRLTLLVDAADRGDERDHANWLDARLVPQ